VLSRKIEDLLAERESSGMNMSTRANNLLNEEHDEIQKQIAEKEKQIEDLSKQEQIAKPAAKPTTQVKAKVLKSQIGFLKKK